jgi:hypothetical protein
VFIDQVIRPYGTAPPLAPETDFEFMKGSKGIIQRKLAGGRKKAQMIKVFIRRWVTGTGHFFLVLKRYHL